MNQEQVLELAWEVGAGEPESLYGRTDYVVMTKHELERFAALVAAAEREACAKVCDSLHDKIDLVEKTEHYPGEYGSEYDAGQGNAISECVDAIRARGEE